MTEINLNLIFQSLGIWKYYAVEYDAWQEQLQFRLVHDLPVDVLGHQSRIEPPGNAGHCIFFC